MCTVSVPPAGKLAVPLVGQLRVPLEMAHVTGPLCVAMLHEIPVPVGSGSDRANPVATPGPALLTVIVNPIAVPALTVAASAVLVTERLGHWTVVCAVAGDGAVPLVRLTVAVFEYTLQLAAVVGLVT
jgi:hypothetical protein